MSIRLSDINGESSTDPGDGAAWAHNPYSAGEDAHTPVDTFAPGSAPAVGPVGTSGHAPHASTSRNPAPELPYFNMREVAINDPATNMNKNFCSNHISTAKYNIFTFLPKFLFEQFSRYANLFFLFISIIQQIPGVSPTGQWTTITPLSVVLVVTAIKELLEDWKRHRADNEVNNSMCRVLRMGTFVTVRWKHLVVGDIVKVANGQFFPADLVLLASSEPHAMCYIETANLDGETNLKMRQGLPMTASLTTARDMRFLSGRVECEPPNSRVDKFVGNIAAGESRAPLGADQLLLRGAQLRSTPWVFGLVVYTGHDSKLLQNATAAPIKRSNVDEVTNRQILLLFVALIVLALISTISSAVWTSRHETGDWYLGFGSEPPQNIALTFLTFMVLYNNLIPISLIVTLEIVKFVQALTFINGDADLYDPPSDTPARARTSTLNEELGQVQYIFSDKTGTLTCNVMRFQKCSIAGVSYGDTVAGGPAGSDGAAFFDPALLDNLTQGHATASYIREWLTLLAVCHTVIPERDRAQPDTIVYQAASPDERALVEAVKQLGFSFNVRTPEGVVVSALGQEERYEVLNVLEFNSTRKRMSVIVRCPGGALKLYCKGADSVILARLAPGQTHVAATEQHLRRFAADGLRTLCLAVAPLTEEAYQTWLATFTAASTALVNRAQRLDDAAELIEKNMILLGATAIEDRLQDDVPDTIRKMGLAGIKVWVLTGDKLETAINIGFACRLLTAKMRLLICSHDSEDDVRNFLTTTLYDIRTSSTPVPPLALIVEGAALVHALSGSLRALWLELALMCPAVICCRVSPAQKADVVRLVRHTCKAITLAIGDGANDVGMIQAAHVGVGISGREGLQAARAADYAIAQFRFLQKLLLVHGAWSYRRVALLILYCFYKNVALYLIQFWFATQNGWSGQILFERWNIALYNVLFTLLPPLALGMFQQHASAASLLAVPALYRSGQRNEHFNTRVFWLWILQAIAHSLVFFWLGREAFLSSVVHPSGVGSGMWLMGAIVYSLVVYTVCFKAALATTHWTVFNHLALWGSMVVWILFTLAYFNLYAAQTTTDIAAEVYGVDKMMYSSAVFWMLAMGIPAVCLFIEFVVHFARANFAPSMEMVVRRQEKFGTVLPAMTAALDEAGLQDQPAHTGYAFSQGENTDSIPQAEVIRRYDTTVDKPEGE